MQKITKHFSIEEILTEIEYEFEGVKIDRPLLISKIKTELSYFGERLCIPKYEILHVERGEVELPKDFKSFIAAMKLEPQQIYCNENIEVLQRVYNMKEYFYELPFNKSGHCSKDNSFCQNSCDCDTEMFHHIEYNAEDIIASVAYKANYPLKLARHSINQNLLSKTYKQNTNTPYEVSIYNGILKTNAFEKSAIYLKYHAFLEDEQGLPMIGEAMNENVRRFVMVVCKRYICESYKLISNDSVRAYAQMFYNNILQEYKILKESLNSELSKPTEDQIIERLQRNRLQMNKYSTAFRYL